MWISFSDTEIKISFIWLIVVHLLPGKKKKILTQSKRVSEESFLSSLHQF